MSAVLIGQVFPPNESVTWTSVLQAAQTMNGYYNTHGAIGQLRTETEKTLQISRQRLRARHRRPNVLNIDRRTSNQRSSSIDSRCG